MKKGWLGLLVSLVVCLAFGGCGFSGEGGEGKGGVPAPVFIPFLLEGDTFTAPPPASGVLGPEIAQIDSIPGLDVVEQGSQYTLIFTRGLSGGDTISSVVLYLEGEEVYYLLPAVMLGEVVTVTFTVNPEYPEGAYPIQLALVDENGVVGPYQRIILYVAFVPTLEIVDLYPRTTISTAEGRVVEPLNVGARVFFTKTVTFADFTLRIEDMAGNTVGGLLEILPGSMSASLLPLSLLNPNQQYAVIATLTADNTTWRNTFWTEKTTPLGADALLAQGRAYSFSIAPENVVEPEAAKIVFGLIGQAIPPFLMMITESDPATGAFSALGTVSEYSGSTLVQDLDAPVVVFANHSEFADPYFLSTPSDLVVSASVGGFNLSLVMHDFTISGKLTPGALSFESGALYLYLDAEELRELAEELLDVTIPPGELCNMLFEIVGQVICNDQGLVTMRAEKLVGNYAPSITALYDLVPASPGPGHTISAGTGGVINISGWITRNNQPFLDSGWQVNLTATQGGTPKGTFSPGATVNVNADGSFQAQLTIGAGQLSTTKPLIITMTCPQMPTEDSWNRTVSVTVLP